MRTRYEYITKVATAPRASWSNREVVQFHYFNPRGLWSEKRTTDKLINDAVDAGKCKSGCIIAHGTLNMFYVDRFTALHDKKRIGNIELAVTLKGLRRDVQDAREFLATLES